MTTSESLTRRRFLEGAMVAGAAGLAASRASSPAAAAPEPAWQIGCYTRPWAAFEYPVAFDAIAEAGFKYVGLMTTKGPGNLVLSVQTTVEEAARVGEEAKKRGLGIPSCYGGGIPVQQSLAAGIEGMKRLIDNCAAAGVRNLMMGGMGNAQLNAVYYQAIADSCAYAMEQGIGISVKPHGGLNSTGPQCRKLIEGVGKPNFKLWYDPGNIFYYSDGALDPVQDAATVDGLVCGMSVKDYLPPKKVDLTPGTGQVNFRAVMARLKQGGFTRGPLIIETLLPGDLPALLVEAKKARQFVEQLVA